jgi:hypothetical protein
MMLFRQSTTLYLAFFLLLFLNACALQPAAKKDAKENNMYFNNLLELNDLFERAFIYHQYCLQDKKSMNPIFMKNFEVISNLLLDEAVYKMKVSPEAAVKRIMDRREVLQQKLSEYYYSKGCQSEEGEIAHSHYNDYSQMLKN